MKKAAALAAALILILTAVPALADDPPWVGTWVISMTTQFGGRVVDVLILEPDGVAEFARHRFSNDYRESFIGSWAETSEGVHVTYGPEEADFRVNEDDLLIGQAFPYTRVGPAPAPNSLPSFRMPVGRFTAGVDFPAGFYKFSLTPDESMAVFTVYSGPDDAFGVGYSLDAGSSPYAAVTLTDGMIVESQFWPLDVSPFTGLEFSY